ncbi:MAG TPA: cell wall-binding repeat-containing protein [Candidatus Binatia bacterium]|nr:cell wall-binding repeat-containing protein [Candidatus Binatia bacterium]
MQARLLRLTIAAALAVGGGAVQAPATTDAAGMPIVRLGGANRYETAALVSASHFGPGVAAAYVATGDDFPDALAGGPAAALARGPILLVSRGAIPAPTAAELSRLQPLRIVVLGGAGVIFDEVLNALAAYQTGGGVTRIGGADRYETAALVSASHFGQGMAAAYVATGTAFPDALVGGVAAARSGSPVLLSAPNALPAATEAELRRLAPAQIFVLGGPGAVSDGVAARLATLATTGAVGRLAGGDRYATGVAVSSMTPVPAAGLFVATGSSFPDALVAVPAAAASGAGLLLVPGRSLPRVVADEAARLAPGRIVLLGGQTVVTDRVTFDLRVALGDLPPLPACAYLDVPTPFATYDDWRRTLLDPIYMLPSDYHPGDLVDTSAAGLNAGHTLRAHVTSDLRAMADAARAAGRPLQVVSAFRSYATQQATFDYWVSVRGYETALRRSARAGHSEHQLGTTVDFTHAGGAAPWDYADWGATPAGAWMQANAWRYGFVMSYPRDRFATVCHEHEPWHYRYFGRDVAYSITVSGLTPREWLWLNGNGG